MAEAWEELAQLDPGAASLTALYTVPSATQIVANLRVANRSNVGTSYRVSVAVGGAADNVKQYKAYDIPIPGNGIEDLLIVAAATDVIRVYATLATLSFTLAGVKIT